MDADDVLGDTFIACSITSISYRVYTLPETLHTTPQIDSNFRNALRRAEVLVRKKLYHCRNSVYTSLGHTGTDIWVYEIHDETDQPKELEMDSVAEILNSIVANLSVTAQGVFMPPFLNTTIANTIHSTSNAVGDGRYGPFLRAIEIRCLDALLKNGDHHQFEAFGYQAAISTGDGSIVKMKPNLSQSGVLSLRMVYQRASLIPLPVSNIMSCATLVWLLPHGKPCRVLSSLRMVSAVEPPNVARARVLYKILASFFVTNISLEQLEKSMWMRVSSTDAGGMLWPAILIRATPLSSGNGEIPHTNKHTPRNIKIADMTSSWHSLPNNRHHLQTTIDTFNTRNSISATRPLAKLEKPDPYTVLDGLMSSIRNPDTNYNHDSGEEDSTAAAAAAVAAAAPSTTLRSHLNPPIPPPSSPRQLSTSVSYNDLRAMANVEHHPQNRLRRVDEEQVSPTTFTPAPSNAPPNQVYPTPSYPTPQLHTPTPSSITPNLDQWIDIAENDEDLEVGDADFNFFDMPVKNEEETNDKLPLPEVLSQTQTQPNLEQEPPNKIKRLETIQEEVYSNNEDTLKPPYYSRSRFGSVNISSLDLDRKYSTGGIFYMKPVENDVKDNSDDDGCLDEHLGPNKETLKQQQQQEETHQKFEDNDDDEDNISDSSRNSDLMTDDNDSDSEIKHAYMFQQPTTFTSEDVESGWYRSIKFDDDYHPLDNTKIDSFRRLISQIVWDSGLLQEICDAPIFRGNVIVAPKYVLERVKMVFMNLTQCSIVHQMKPLGINGAITPGIISNSNLPSNNSNGKQSMSFQLFSPPLVAVCRGDAMLRARISILRFWRLLGLQPLNATSKSKIKEPLNEGNSNPGTTKNPSTSTSITLILVTMSSPAVVSGARQVLSKLCESYEGCNLGKIHLPSFGDVDNGLFMISADLNHTAGDAVGDLYEHAFTKLRTQLLTTNIFENLLLLVCYPPSSLRGGTLTAMVPFQIAQGVAEIQERFPLTQWMLSSLDLLVSRWNHDQELSMFEVERIAHHIYNRFPHFQPAFKLASLAPKTSGLQYTIELPQYLMEDEPVLHVAYLIGKHRWCLVSWSDQWAQTTHVDVYKIQDSSDRALQLVFQEIWNKTVEFSRNLKDHGNWRFCITKCGPMLLYEKEVWSKVIVPSVSVVLMDTPHQGGVDSEHVLTGFQPKQYTDILASADNVVVDQNDVVYGASIGLPLPLVSGYVNAAAKGFLIRHQPGGYLSIFEVRLLVLNEFKIPPRSVMSRVIGQFRRLASLAEYTGVTRESTLIPWHIVALTKLEGAALKLNMF